MCDIDVQTYLETQAGIHVVYLHCSVIVLDYDQYGTMLKYNLVET